MHKLFETHRRTWVQAIFVLLSGMIVLGSPQDAHAAGRVIWKSTTLKERTKNESWYLEMEIHLGSPPAVSSKSMKFEFTQIVEFERSLEDGREEPVLREIPLTNQQSLIESQLVGFMDPGTGQIQARTRFSFKVTRAHGYRAGKWKVKIKDGDTGSQIGTTCLDSSSTTLPTTVHRSTSSGMQFVALTIPSFQAAILTQLRRSINMRPTLAANWR